MKTIGFILSFFVGVFIGLTVFASPIEEHSISAEGLDSFYRASLLNHYGKLKYSVSELAEISTVTVRYAEKYNVNQHLMLAIFMTESSLGRHVKGIHGGRLLDYGWGQINVHNVKRLGLDKDKLLTDMEYSIRESVKFMQGVQKGFSKKESSYFWSRYHSYTPHLRDKYEKRVLRWLEFMKVYSLPVGFQHY